MPRGLMISNSLTRRSFGSLMLGSLAACTVPIEDGEGELTAPGVSFIDGYGPIFDAGYTLPPVPEDYTQGVNRRMTGFYVGEQSPGTIDVDPYAKFLYWIPPEGVENTIRYPVGVEHRGPGDRDDREPSPLAPKRRSSEAIAAYPQGERQCPHPPRRPGHLGHDHGGHEEQDQQRAREGERGEQLRSPADGRVGDLGRWGRPRAPHFDRSRAPPVPTSHHV